MSAIKNLRTYFTKLLVLFFFCSTSYAQVGIGTTDPKTMLDINGALSLRESPDVLSMNSNNFNSISSSAYSSYRVTSSGNFRIRTIAPSDASDGQLITITNTTGNRMGFQNERGSPTEGRILVPGGSTNYDITGIYSSVTLQYNKVLERWIVKSTNAAGSTSTSNDGWALDGNAGTTAGTNFLGTTDNESLELFSNNTSRMRVENDGQVSIGLGAFGVNANQQFNVLSTFTNGTAIGGYGTGSGSGVYGQNVGTGAAVEAVQGSTGEAIYAVNFSTGITGYFESFSGNYSVFGLDGPIFADNRTFGGEALMGFGNSAGPFSGGLENGVWGVNDDVTGTAVLGGTGDTYILPSNGSGVAGSSPSLGIYGYSGFGSLDAANYGHAGGQFSLDNDLDPLNGQDVASATIAGFDNINPDDGNGPIGSGDSYFGGYFSGGNESGTPSYAYVGLKHNTTNGVNGTDYKIIGPGNVSTLIKDASGTPRIMFASESPEIVFTDYGVGQLTNGTARIDLDPILKSALHIDNQHPLKVFVTLEGECNGIYVTNKSAEGFTVKELQGGRSNISFSWQIVANRADTKDANGRTVSKHVGLRLPVGPVARKTIKKKSKTLPKASPTRKTLKTSSKKAKITQAPDPENSSKSLIDQESDKK